MPRRWTGVELEPQLFSGSLPNTNSRSLLPCQARFGAESTLYLLVTFSKGLKMRCHHANSHLEVLFRVFVQPPTVTRALPLRNATIIQSRTITSVRNHRPILQLQNAFAVQKRSVRWKPPGKQVEDPKAQPQDEQIDSERVNFVDDGGNFSSGRLMRPLLRSINRNEDALVQVAEGNPSLPPDNPQRWPTVKVMSKRAIRERAAEQAKVARKAHKTQKTGKIVEISWQIEPHDLKHRLAKAKDFLEGGHKLEIMLAQKKRSKKVVELDDCEDILERIRDELQAISGAHEVRTEGKLGEEMTLFWKNEKA